MTHKITYILRILRDNALRRWGYSAVDAAGGAAVDHLRRRTFGRKSQTVQSPGTRAIEMQQGASFWRLFCCSLPFFFIKESKFLRVYGTD